MKTKTITILVKERDHVEVISNCLLLGLFVGTLYTVAVVMTAAIISNTNMLDTPSSPLYIIMISNLLMSIVISILSLVIAYASDISIKEIRKTIKVIE